MLDIQLKIFKTVVDKNSFSKAALELSMTQSAVSHQISNLENHYGVKLFDRLHRRIVMTEAGAALYPLAVEMERLCQEAEKTMQGLMGEISGRLYIGASLTIGEYLMPEMLIAFKQRYPKVDITMEIFNTEQITAMVADGQIHIGFVEGPYPEADVLCALPCGGDYLVIVAPPNWKLSSQPRLEDMLNEKWVLREPASGTRRVFEQFLTAQGYDPSALNVVMELGSTQAVKEAVKAGLGLSALSHLTIVDEVERGGIKIVPSAEGTIKRAFTMIYHRERFWTSAVETFRSFVISNSQSAN